MTFFFLLIIIGTTSKARAGGLRRHPDRSGADADPPDHDPGHQHLGEPGAQHRPRRCSPAAAYIGQLWLFWLAPIIGALIAGFLTRWMYDQEAIIETTIIEERMVS